MQHSRRRNRKLAIALLASLLLTGAAALFVILHTEDVGVPMQGVVRDETSRLQLQERFAVNVTAVLRNESSGLSTVHVEETRGSIELVGVPDVQNISTLEIVPHNDGLVRGNVAVVEGTVVERAVIRLAKTGAVAGIARCDDYDANRRHCAQWVKSDIAFTDHGSFVEFEVPHFTGYGVIPKSERLFVTGTSNFADSTATASLADAQDGGANDVSQTLASGTLYTMLNASAASTEARVIRTNDQISFSGHFAGGSRVNFAYATFKLYAGTNGGTIVCQSGNDGTGGAQIPSNNQGLLAGTCSPSNNITVLPGDNFYYVINVWADSIGGGGPDSQRSATISWDTATADTWVNVSSVQLVDVDLVTNTSNVYPGQSVNASGTFYYFNGSGVSGATVNVSFWNSSNGVVQSASVVTTTAGAFSSILQVPGNNSPGTWKVNVSAEVNSSVHAINETTFTANYLVNTAAPVNDTLVDRDSYAPTTADSIQLIASTAGVPSAGTTITFYANLSSPGIGGQTDLLLGSNTTNSSGQAVLWFNPDPTRYAGNYTWWAQGASGAANSTRRFSIFGELQTVFRNATRNPNGTYFANDTAQIHTNLTSAGPESEAEIAGLYAPIVNGTFRNTTGTTSTTSLSNNPPFWQGSLALNSLLGPGVWSANTTAAANYFFSGSQARPVTVYGYMNVTGNLTTPASVFEGDVVTTSCQIQDTHIQYPVQGVSVDFYRNSTLLGSNTTNSSGQAILAFSTSVEGNYTVTCNVTDQPASLYFAGPASEGASQLEVLGIPRPPYINDVAVSAGVEHANLTWTTDRLANSSVQYGTTTALSGGSNSSPGLVGSHGISIYGLQENVLYYYNITSCSSIGCNTTGPLSFSTAADLIAPSVALLTPASNSGDGDGTVTFTYTPSDNYGISSCTIYIDGSSRGTDIAPIDGSFTVGGITSGDRLWTVGCTDSSSAANVANASSRSFSVINASSFSTLNLSGVAMNAVNGFYIENAYARINFSGTIDLTGGPDLNSHTQLANASVVLDGAALSVLDIPARLTMHGLPFQFTPDIEHDGALCSASCTSISYAAGELSFNVSGFSNYTAKGNTELEISDQTDAMLRRVDEQILFYANYTRRSNSNPISGAGIFCEFTENSSGSYSTPVNMTFNATSQRYELNTSFTEAGVHTFQVTCDGSVSGYEVFTLSDTFTVTALSGAPAFGADVTDGSSSGSPTLHGANITFSGTATDPEVDDWEFIVCNATGLSGTSCSGTEWCRSGTASSGAPASCQVNTTGLTLENYSWAAYACDVNQVCGAPSTANSPFHVNHPPSISTVTISPAAPNSTSTLSCIVGVSDDDNDIVTIDYAWFLQDDGSGTFSQLGATGSTLASVFDSGDVLLCQATPTDEHGATDAAMNSSTVTIALGSLSADNTLASTQIVYGQSTVLSASCTIAAGEAASVTLTIQDNRTGAFAQSSTNPADIYVNMSSIAIGALNDSSASFDITVYGQTVGTYSLRALCQAADTNPTIALGTAEDLEITVDSTPPVISGVSVIDRTQTSARLTWSTDDASDSLVNYGATASLGVSVYDPSDVTSHSVLLIGLTEGTQYHYNLTSCNADGFCATHGTDTFLTLEELDLAPASQKGYCTAVFIEQGSNYRPGYISKGDVVEFYCESPSDIAEREHIELTVLNKNRQLHKEIATPGSLFGEQVVVYP